MEGKTIRTICHLCHTNCGIIVKTSPEGSISVAPDPNHPANGGRCCPKIAAISGLIKSRDRLTQPLKKTSSGFKQITWDEALNIAADKLTEIKKKYGASTLVRCTGAPLSYHSRDGFRQFMGAFGTPNQTGSGNLCMVSRMMASDSVVGERRAEPDFDKASLVIFWGANPYATERLAAFSSYNILSHALVSKLKSKDVKLITIDPVRTKIAGESDQWIQINPGTDIAMGLAMIHVIIKEDLYDKDFVTKYTQGFDKLKSHVQSLDPKWAESITGVPENVIASLARTYANTRPAAILEGNGFDQYANVVDSTRMVAMLTALTGNFDIPGGNVVMPFVRQPMLPVNTAPAGEKLTSKKFPLFMEAPFPAVKEAVLEDWDNRPRAMIVHHANPVLIQANQKRTIQFMEKLDFVIACDIFATATTETADLVLPTASAFECYGYRAYSSNEGGYFALSRPIANPVGESIPVFDIEYKLAEKMKIQQSYPFKNSLEWVNFMIKPSGVSFEQLEKEQIVYATAPIKYRKYAEKGFNTPSGKVELYSEKYEKLGYNPMPTYSQPAGEQLDSKTLAQKGFPLLGVSQRPGIYTHTRLKNIEAISKLYPDPLAKIHKIDAADRDVKDGDMIEVTSPQGKIKIKAQISDDIKPGYVTIDFGWGNPTDGKASINQLTNDAFWDPVSGATPNRLFPCEVRICSHV